MWFWRCYAARYTFTMMTHARRTANERDCRVRGLVVSNEPRLAAVHSSGTILYCRLNLSKRTCSPASMPAPCLCCKSCLLSLPTPLPPPCYGRPWMQKISPFSIPPPPSPPPLSPRTIQIRPFLSDLGNSHFNQLFLPIIIICKASTLRLKALNKHSVIHIMYMEMEMLSAIKN